MEEPARRMDPGDLGDLLQRLEQTQRQLEGIQGFSTRELEEVHTRLSNRHYLVAVFGAFSAGKSSLLNALLDDSMLVVSPNPTTASVTRISAPRADTEVESITITAKTEQELWRDVANVFALLHENPQSLTEAMMQASVLNARDYPTSVRTHIRFLKSVAQGYDEMLPKLGQSWTVEQAHFERFTADEKQAAYIARVDVARRNSWLNRGFVFVDTPGVDSIHRRHTDVAFRYMRHADAVLFVMYYTHAFTQRDRDFLVQLSGVQDVTETNKLFTVINAVDLATSDDERAAVRQRVEEELRRLGIRRPRVYEVSSQLALAGRGLKRLPEDEAFQAMARARANLSTADVLPSPASLIEASGLLHLETDLQAYIETEGNALARDIVSRTLAQIRDQALRAVSDTTVAHAEDVDMRQDRLAQLATLKIKLDHDFAQVVSDTSVVQRGLMTNLEELVFHAGERIRFRYRDMFRQSFHPGRFRMGRPQDKLQDAALELTDSLCRQIDIEIRTFSLRASALVATTYAQTLVPWRTRCADVLLYPPFNPSPDTDYLVAEDVRSSLPSDIFRPYFHFFSSAKQFFEDGGSKAMMDASEHTIIEHVQRELAAISDVLMSQAWSSLSQALRGAYETACESISRAHDEFEQPLDGRRLEQLQHLTQLLDDTRISNG